MDLPWDTDLMVELDEAKLDDLVWGCGVTNVFFHILYMYTFGWLEPLGFINGGDINPPIVLTVVRILGYIVDLIFVCVLHFRIGKYR